MHEFFDKVTRLELPHVATALGAGAAVASFAGGNHKIMTALVVSALGLAWAASRLPCCAGCAAGQGCGGSKPPPIVGTATPSLTVTNVFGALV